MAILVVKRPYDIAFSGNPVVYQLYSDAAKADRTIYFEIKVVFGTVNGALADVITLPWYPTDGYATIDIKDILHERLQYGLPPLNIGSTSVFKAAEQSGYYYLAFREITATDSDPAWDETEASVSNRRFVVKGGLHYNAFRGNNYWINYFNTNQPFLTWQKNGRLAAATERIYLAWLCRIDAVLQAVCTVHYVDSTTSSTTTDLNSVKDMVHFIPAGYGQWNLGAIDPSKAVHYWTLQVKKGSGEAVSEVFAYYLDNRNDYNNVTLHYRNSLGGLDSVRVRGVIEKNQEYAYSEQDTTTQADYYAGNVVEGRRSFSSVSERTGYKGDIGHVGKEEQDRLRDLLLQRETYREQTGKWIPYLITTKSFKQTNSLDNRWSVPLEFEPAAGGSEFYTPESINLGDGTMQGNACLASLGNVVITLGQDGNTPDGQWKVNASFTESDPQNAATQYRWRIVGVSNWVTNNMSSLGIFTYLDMNSGTYTLELQAICEGNNYGPVTPKTINTAQQEQGGGNSGGGGTTPPTAPVVQGCSVVSFNNMYPSASYWDISIALDKAVTQDTVLTVSWQGHSDTGVQVNTGVEVTIAAGASGGATQSYASIENTLNENWTLTDQSVANLSGETVTIPVCLQ